MVFHSNKLHSSTNKSNNQFIYTNLKTRILLITPLFTQLNTPYPATVFLKGFLNSIGVASLQADLGIETILELFSKKNLELIFNQLESSDKELSINSLRIVHLKDEYLKTIDSVIEFLQNKKLSLAHLICQGDYLPQASRYSQTNDLEWAFGTMGTHDKARHLATLYMEDLGDLITECIDPHFGFSRYAEHLGRYANEFDDMETELSKPNSFIDNILIELLDKKIQDFHPDLLAISVPFPGNLFSAFRCGQFVKTNYPNIKIAMGGGFANTELRSLSEERVFKYFDYVCLDDGELPLQCIIEYIESKRELRELKRTFALKYGTVSYINGAIEKDYAQNQLDTPDYTDLFLDKYLSVIEIANPMHSLWSNGRWNKLMLAHGCYWANCSFCDTSLNYISHFEPLRAKKLVDKIEKMIEQTGENGFHFVDEAAPPALLRELALEIIRRKITVVWWTNIRFEKNFTEDLCRLLSSSGCIAVSGGIEVASDRLLKLINKGVDIAQLTKAADNFTHYGIMVHAYLMYGYPTQTEHETIDSLEVVRQLFKADIVQSGFWHRFALTVHSDIAQNPDNYSIKLVNQKTGKFANNDLDYEELGKTNHEKFAEGLRISLYNYMHGAGFDFPLQNWFGFKIPKTTVKPGLIEELLVHNEFEIINIEKRIIWLGNKPEISYFTKTKKNKSFEVAELVFYQKKGIFNLKLDKKIAIWLSKFLLKVSVFNSISITVRQMELDYLQSVDEDFMLFLHGKSIKILRENGLLFL
jgi:radical SAM superfamily enzyme YgiQ (UPF0313 family)